MTILVLPAFAAEPSGFAVAHGPAQEGVTVALGVDAGARASGALRLADPSLGRTGLVSGVGAEWTALPALDVGGAALVGVGNAEDRPASLGGSAWARLAAPVTGGLVVGGELGAHRELTGDWAVTATGLATVGKGPVEAAANVVLERRFAERADPVDLMIPVEAAVSLSPTLRVGAAYVGQDLEDYFEGEEEEEAEGGASHVALATARARIGAVVLTIAPGVGIGPGGVGFVGRALLEIVLR